MKKFLAVLLAVLFAVSMTTVALADTTYSINILNKNSGHTYEAYQIFIGTVAEDKGHSLSGIIWGDGISEAGKTALLSFGKTEGAYANARELAESLTEANAEDFAAAASKYLVGPQGSASVVKNGKYTISGLNAGYYLIKDKDDTLDGQNDSYTSYILRIVGNVDVQPKSDIPSVEKKVKDINDSTDAKLGDWQDSADYDIGDVIPFSLNGTLPANFASYKTYVYAFHDSMTGGLTYQNDAAVYAVNGGARTEITASFEIKENGGKLDLFCKDLKRVAATVNANTKIVVEYTAVLNEKAVIGFAGNPNTVTLEYSNNPNYSGEGLPEEPPTGHTPEDKVVVFTYELDVNKVDQDNNPLAGAGFTLFKFDAKKNDYVAVSDEISGEQLTTFVFKGLDDGIYKLSETTTPDGYNAVDDVVFEVSANHETNSADPKLLEIDVNNEAFVPQQAGTVDEPYYTGVISTTVVNRHGSFLPGTGGVGTKLMYVFGGLMLLAAGVLLIARKRLSFEANI